MHVAHPDDDANGEWDDAGDDEGDALAAEAKPAEAKPVEAKPAECVPGGRLSASSAFLVDA